MAESRSRYKSPIEQHRKRVRKIALYIGIAVLAVAAVGLLTSYLYSASHGEKWRPFSFLSGTKTAPTLPIQPSIVPVDVLVSIADGSTSVPVTSTEAAQTVPTETAAPVSTPEETAPPQSETPPVITEPPVTDEPSSAEPITEEPTPEETTPEETTTETPTEPPVETTTEEPFEFDETELSSHLKEAGLAEEALKGTQLVIVRGTTGTRCVLYCFEKGADGWQLSAAVAGGSGYLGSGGISAERKPGDQTTPAGYFALGPAYGAASSAITALDYHQLESGDVWVSDPASAHFNSLQNDHDPDADWGQSINLLTQAGIYKYAILINSNPASDPAHGCSVFLNLASSSTDGSVALREVTLFSLLQWLSPEADPHVLIYQGRSH